MPPIFFAFCDFGNKYGVRGSIFGHMLGPSENVLKSIAIDKESLISNCGTIKTLKQTHNYIKKQRKNKTSHNLFCPIETAPRSPQDTPRPANMDPERPKTAPRKSCIMMQSPAAGHRWAPELTSGCLSK